VERTEETLRATGVRDRAELAERTRVWAERERDWRWDRQDRIAPLAELTGRVDAGIRVREARERTERAQAERAREERSRALEPGRDGQAGSGGEDGPERDRGRNRGRGLDLGW
jgi:hypothetical protein